MSCIARHVPRAIQGKFMMVNGKNSWRLKPEKKKQYEWAIRGRLGLFEKGKWKEKHREPPPPQKKSKQVCLIQICRSNYPNLGVDAAAVAVVHRTRCAPHPRGLESSGVGA
jgi:hypothetical protein